MGETKSLCIFAAKERIRMKRFLSLVVATSMASTLMAQSELSTFKTPSAMKPLSSAYAIRPQAMQPQLMASPSLSMAAAPNVPARSQRKQAEQHATHEEELDSVRWYPTPHSTYYNYGPLHEGLNVSLDMSAFATFGKHAKGGGFGQRLTATWLQSLGKHGWVAAGGYINHMNWRGDNYTSGGLTAEVGYQFDDHWSAYVYGQKSLVNQGGRYAGLPPYGLGCYGWGYSPFFNNDLGDKLGAAVRWTPNPTLSIEVSVEKNWYPKSNAGYWGQYNYPMPQNN